jgi:hypothetical protein
MRKSRGTKTRDPEEKNKTKLDPRLVGHHFDAYWQICKALGCSRMPTDSNPIGEEVAEQEAEEKVVERKTGRGKKRR